MCKFVLCNVDQINENLKNTASHIFVAGMQETLPFSLQYLALNSAWWHIKTREKNNNKPMSIVNFGFCPDDTRNFPSPKQSFSKKLFKREEFRWKRLLFMALRRLFIDSKHFENRALCKRWHHHNHMIDSRNWF